jgi:hypothetical protein
MPGPQSMLQLLPYVVRLFPTIQTLPIIKGLAIPINDVHGITDPELARNLARKTSIKKKPTFNDNSSVIKVSEAIKCVEDQFNNTTLLKEFVLVAVKQVIGDTEKTAAQDLADRMADCFRENSLRQNTPRVRVTKRYAKRPSN